MARELTLDERIRAQKAIEQVYWLHRTWPQQNAQPKPPLSAVLPDDAIRARVEDTLKKSAALESWWRRPLTAKQLQAEMDRMATHSRDPRMLRELFDALGNDPYVIAETLARPSLADRLVRNWYAFDDRFHGALHAQARAARDGCASSGCLKTMGGEYRETTSTLDDAGASREEIGPSLRTVRLDEDDWSSLLERIASRVGGTAAAPRIGRLSDVEETSDGFYVTTVLSHDEKKVVTATTTWPKRTFDAWWDSQRREFSSSLPTTSHAMFTLPAIPQTACTNDTWSPTFQDVPEQREEHTAVWTGSEMIVWGGEAYADLRTLCRYDPATDTWQILTAPANAPAGLWGHTAIWTGTEMIVWGGYPRGPGPGYNTGGRYNPLTDTWIPTSTGANVPTPRGDHVAVWTGSEMIVWGGYNTSTGGRYDPVSDTWMPTATGAFVPSPRVDETVVWTGNRMIVWGGRDPSYLLNTGGLYDPATDTWSPTSTGANAPVPRTVHSAVWTGSRMIVWGGSVPAPCCGPYETSTGALYDPTTDSWAPTSIGTNVPAARSEHSAVWTGQEMIVWGGQYQQNGQHSLNSGGRYDPVTDQWMPTSVGANVPAGRFLHSTVWTGEEMIVWGGMGPAIFGFLPMATGGRYDPASDTWTPTRSQGSVPLHRSYHSAIFTGTEMIIFGGYSYDSGPTTLLNSGGRYLPATDSWTPTAVSMGLPPRLGHTAVWTGREMIVWGGFTFQPAGGYRYDPLSDSWAAISTIGEPTANRVGHVAIWTGRHLIVWGGTMLPDQSVPLNTGGRYDPLTDQWLPMSTGANVPSARSGTSAVWTGTEMIVWGGADSSVPTSSGGRYDPMTDHWTATSQGANVPSARSTHSAVWTGTEMLVWGGWDSGTSMALNSGGRYDPVTNQWSSTSLAANVPQARYRHTGIWTGREMIVWGGGNYSNTGGRYDPVANAWNPTSQVWAPDRRLNFSTVWTGTEMIIWGGDRSSSMASGGRYCACPNGTLVYRDSDGDGRGDPGVSAPSCDGSAPAGYVLDHTDCNDANRAVHPGAVEICNGLDDDCDGATDAGDLCNDSDACTTDACASGVCDHEPVAVAEVDDSVTVTKSSGGAAIGWTDIAGPFNVYRGSTAAAPWSYNATCFASDAANPTTDASSPLAGSTLYYLVSRVGACGESALGHSSAGAPIPNDAPCP